jgi:hypothetical protein
MSMNSFISGSETKRLLLHLVGPFGMAILLIVFFNASLKALGLEPRLVFWGKSFDDYDVIYTKAIDAKRRGKRIVAFIGDSRIEWGLDPDAIQNALENANLHDIEVFNLALPGRNVRTILTRLNEVGFYPDVLLVGYSHLSFYWSKNYVTTKPNQLGWWKSDLARIRSFAQRKLVTWPYAPIEVKNYLVTRTQPGGGSWLDEIDITPHGQARVHYLKPEAEAVTFQKKFYQDMYNVTMTDEVIAETNASFLKDISVQRQHGTKVLLLKMPLSGWALELERANERATLADLAAYLKTPFVDGNEAPDASTLSTFDGLHLTPPSAIVFADWLAKNFVLPQFK